MIVNILGADYTVKVGKLKKGLFGDCDTDKKLIRVNDEKGEPAETLIHEVIHAALHESGVVHIINHTEGLEEAIVRAVEHGLRTAEMIPDFPIEEKEEETHESN